MIVFFLRFGNDLLIAEKLFVMDAGASNTKDMKLLRNLLLELRTTIISVRSVFILLHLPAFYPFSYLNVALSLKGWFTQK